MTTWDIFKDNYTFVCSVALNIIFICRGLQQWWKFRVPLKLWATISANYTRTIPPGLHPPQLDFKPSYELTVTVTNNGRERITIISCHAVVGNSRYGLASESRGHVTLEPNTAPAIYSAGLTPEILGSIQEIILLDGRGKSHRVPRKVVESVRSAAVDLHVSAAPRERDTAQ